MFSSSKQGKILFPKATSSEPLDKAKGSEEICSLNVSDQGTETRLLDPSMDTNGIGYFYDKTESFTEMKNMIFVEKFGDQLQHSPFLSH